MSMGIIESGEYNKVAGNSDNDARIEELEAKVADLKEKTTGLGTYTYSGILGFTITGGSTTKQVLATNKTLKAGKTYLVGLHVSQNPTDGACCFMVCKDASGTGISYWENDIVCPVGKFKTGQSFPVYVSADTPLFISCEPYVTSTGSWAAGAEISILEIKS